MHTIAWTAETPCHAATPVANGEESPSSPSDHRGIRWVTLTLTVALLLLAHGCHGDEDHELLNLGGMVSHSWREATP